MHIFETNEISLEYLNFIIAEIIYGGKTQDDKDYKLVKSILK